MLANVISADGDRVAEVRLATRLIPILRYGYTGKLGFEHVPGPRAKEETCPGQQQFMLPVGSRHALTHVGGSDVFMWVNVRPEGGIKLEPDATAAERFGENGIKLRVGRVRVTASGLPPDFVWRIAGNTCEGSSVQVNNCPTYLLMKRVPHIFEAGPASSNLEQQPITLDENCVTPSTFEVKGATFTLRPACN